MSDAASTDTGAQNATGNESGALAVQSEKRQPDEPDESTAKGEEVKTVYLKTGKRGPPRKRGRTIKTGQDEAPNHSAVGEDSNGSISSSSSSSSQGKTASRSTQAASAEAEVQEEHPQEGEEEGNEDGNEEGNEDGEEDGNEDGQEEQEGDEEEETDFQDSRHYPAQVRDAIRLYASRIAGITAAAKTLAEKKKPLAQALKTIKTYMIENEVDVVELGKLTLRRSVAKKFTCNAKSFKASDDIPEKIKKAFIRRNTTEAAVVQLNK